MSDQEKKQSDKKIEERKDYKRDLDYSEKMQSPEPWPEPPDDKNKNGE